MQKQLKINDLAVQIFADSVEDLIEVRRHWEQNAFKSANDSLYGLLTQIYKMYDETCKLFLHTHMYEDTTCLIW